MVVLWILLTVFILALTAGFWFLKIVVSRMKAGDGKGTLRACRRLAVSWAAAVAGEYGCELVNRLANHPEAVLWREFLICGLRPLPFALVGAVSCWVFWKKGKTLCEKEKQEQE